MLSFRHKKQTGKNVADITFKFTHYYIRKLYFYLEVKNYWKTMLNIFMNLNLVVNFHTIDVYIHICIYMYIYIYICIYVYIYIPYLKLVSAIFTKFLFFHHMIALHKLWQMLFISSKELFWFSRYSVFCISVLPSFSTCRPLL